jgi:hypothetical protein
MNRSAQVTDGFRTCDLRRGRFLPGRQQAGGVASASLGKASKRCVEGRLRPPAQHVHKPSRHGAFAPQHNMCTARCSCCNCIAL